MRANEARQNIWQQTTVHSGKWQQEQGIWELNIQRDREAQTIFGAHVILANGGGLMPSSPTYDNQVSDITHLALCI
jgi:cation diffusion facilitator CzcD-associated flavoprotein CzcO